MAAGGDRRGQRNPAPPEDLSYKWASGGFLSTAEDLVRFGSDLINGSLLEESTIDLLFSSTVTADGQPTGVGLGWMLSKDRKGHKVVYHNGNLPSARAHLMVYPEDAVVVAILANTGQMINFNDAEANHIAELFVHPAEPALAVLDDEYLGSWQFNAVLPVEDKTTSTLLIDTPALTHGDLALH